jgi:phospholipid/cholesterol/gamma-HCH transport system permease protein
MYPFFWLVYVLGILGGWMAGVYGGFTSSAEFIDGAQRISSHFIVYAFLKTLILRCYWQPYLLSMLLHERWL